MYSIWYNNENEKFQKLWWEEEKKHSTNIYMTSIYTLFQFVGV